jgi:hypothetical protein
MMGAVPSPAPPILIQPEVLATMVNALWKTASAVMDAYLQV